MLVFIDNTMLIRFVPDNDSLLVSEIIKFLDNCSIKFIDVNVGMTK